MVNNDFKPRKVGYGFIKNLNVPDTPSVNRYKPRNHTTEKRMDPKVGELFLDGKMAETQSPKWDCQTQPGSNVKI